MIAPTVDYTILAHAFGSVFTLFTIGVIGYLLARKGWFTPEAKALLPRLVTVVALPAFMLHNMSSSFSRDELMHLVYGSLIPFASICLCLLLSILVGKIIKVRPVRKGIFQTAFATSNTMFIGVPVNLALFGEAALPYVLLYFFANASIFWTVGNYMLAADGGHKEKIFSKASLKQVFSPPMLGFLAGMLVLLLDIKLPIFIAESARYLGNMTTPLILIFFGVLLHGVQLRSVRLDKELVGIYLGRFVVSPLTVILLCYFFPLPDLMRKVFIIQSSLPTVASISILTAYYKSDPEFAAVVVSTTTLLSMLTLPLFMVLLSS